MKRGAGVPWGARPLLILLLLAAASAAAAPVDDALARARAQRLWEQAPWLSLGHYKRSRWLGRLESDATRGFFLSPDGVRDPRAELEAELAGLYSSQPAGDEHVRCRFPARTAWLVERLALDSAELAAPACAKYRDWRTLMDAGSASLIFASAYLDNPSSMFGHTFLRLERRSTGGDPLRDNTLNFAADTGADGGVLFAVKGLLGLYPGKYTVMPYYMKIAEYNAIENRDLWEYRLALSGAEVDRLAAHAWEMGPAQFPYYFFSKNCSYQLMPVLEAAAPRLALMPGSPPIVGPVDTLLAVRAAPGLVSEVRYRPSHATEMLSRRARLDPAERRAAWAYARGRVDEGDSLSEGFPPARRARVLDAAQDYILYKEGYSPDVAPEVRARERPILLRRAKVPEPSASVPAPSWAAPPEEGHLRRRLQFGGGARNGGSFAELAWRPGYHDLLDRSRGFLPGAAIEGFTARLRYDRDEKHLYVRDARLVEILSAAPYDTWTRKPSWSAGTGLDTAFELGKPAHRSLVYEGHIGTGLSAAPWDGALVFSLLQAEGSVGSPLHDGYRAGGALRGGLAVDVSAQGRVMLDGELAGTAFGDKTPNHRLRAAVNWAQSRDRALRVEGLLRGSHREAGLYGVIYY